MERGRWITENNHPPQNLLRDAYYKIMAKKTSGTLYLRKTVETNGSTFNSGNIDVSAYVNPLDGEVLRIKKVWGEWASDSGGAILTADVDGTDGSASAMAQLTTVSQDSIKQIVDSSLFFKTQLYCTVDNASGTQLFTLMREDNAMNPTDFEDGFLVASDIIQVGVNCSPAPQAFVSDIEFQVLIECERVKMSQSDAFAVLSAQQQD